MVRAARSKRVDAYTVASILSGVASWDELKAELAARSEIEKGAVFERLTQLYLQLNPVYQSKLRHVWLLAEVPIELASQLNLPATDKGIDLIAETFEGDYWAIQCKYRDDQGVSIPFRELSTFAALADSVSRKIAFKLVCTSTEHITKELRGLPNLGIVAIDTWSQLEKDFFQAMKLKLAAKPVVIVPKKPRPHQQRAIDNGLAYFVDQQNTRGKLIAPCGSGKSLTGFWLAESLGSRLTLVAVPSLALIKQTLTVWLREFVAQNKHPDWRCVCSDESAGQVSEDDLVVFSHDLGIECTTNEDQVSKWLSSSSAHPRVLFTTYQSAQVVSAAARKAGVEFDVAILDEAHKTVGHNDRLFSHLLFDENIKIRRRIFMTATERQYRGDSDKIVTMDDSSVYGETFELLTFKEAIQADPPVLSDYEVIIVGVTNGEVHTLIENKAFVSPSGGDWREIDAQTFAGLIALRKALNLKELNIRHTVSFHKSIARAKNFGELQGIAARTLPGERNIHTYHVSGQMTTARRTTILIDFAKHAPSLVTNARCLTEGVDIPNIDCVFFADPRRSAIDIVQASGRAMRCADGKKNGYIVVPVFVPSGVSEHEVVEASEFNSVFSILRALASNDERIVEYFRSISLGSKPSSSIIHFNVNEITPQDVSTSEFVQSLELRCWNKLARLAWRPFEDAQSYVQSLKLRSYSEWKKYCNSGKKPPDIPSSPWYVYKENWQSMGEWLGTGTVAPYLIEYRPFDQARAFVQGLGLKNGDEWKEYCQSGRKPHDIPTAAWNVYRSDWVSMGDWLGTDTIANRYKKQRQRSFENARAHVRQLNLKSTREWRDFCASGKKPDDIPAYPDEAYSKQGWISWGDFLGTGTVAPYLIKYRPFKDARDFVRALGLKNQDEWKEYCRSGKKPDHIPATPRVTYKDEGWAGLGDWLGTGRQYRGFRSFAEARTYVHSLKLKNVGEWRALCRSGKLPADIPKSPWLAYKNQGWISMGDWLGTGSVASSLREYRPFEASRDYARSLNLKSSAEWTEHCKSGAKPEDIPTKPDRVYKKSGWLSWGDFLGTGVVASHRRRYRPFKQARAFVHTLGLKNQHEWGVYSRSGDRPNDIPGDPWTVYRDTGWMGYGDWLGTGRIANRNKPFWSFKKARTYVRKLGLKNQHDWARYCASGKKPAEIPSNPAKTYKDEGWIGFGDWIGTGTVSNRDKPFWGFKKARAYVRALGLKDRSAWRGYCRSGKRPAELPANPDTVYKDDGWINYGDWLGTGTISTRDREYWDFKKARVFVRKLRLKNVYEWREYCGSGKKPPQIPSAPDRVYKGDGWAGTRDWLGTERV